MRLGRLENALGFTLIEAMLTLAVSSIVMLGGLSVMALAIRYFNLTLKSLEADTELLSALAVVKEHMTQAVDLKRQNSGQECFTTLNSPGGGAYNNAGGGTSNNNFHGRIERCPAGTFNNFNQKYYLAVFNAELGQYSNRLRGVSIAFDPPGRGIGSDSGALFITRPANNTPDGGNSAVGDLTPGSHSIMFTELVAAEVDEVRVRSEGAADQGRVILNGVGMAVSAKVTLTRRVFLSRARDYCFPVSECGSYPSNLPADDIPKFVDRSRSVTVSFRNNLQLERGIPDLPGLPGGTAMRKRTFGNLYFFRPITPELGRN